MRQVSPLYDAGVLRDDPQALRQRAVQDGYVFLPGALPAAPLLSLRAEISDILLELGWISGEPLSLQRDPQQQALVECGSDEWRAFYDRVQCLRSFHALAHHPDCKRFADAVCGGVSFFHPRHICRLIFPGLSRITTPPHQDYFYIGGSEDTWTAWIPLGDCSRSLGSLAVLPGSHRRGLLPVHAAEGAGGHACDVSEDQWHASDFRCGDVLCIHSLLIHQGQDNRTDNELRLSVDVRFQSIAEAVHPSSLLPHMQSLTWQDIYADWPAHDELRYYWQQLPLQVTE